MSMSAFIQGEFVNIVLKAMRKYAEKKNVSEKDVQILMGLSEKGEDIYKMCVKYTPTEDVTFLNILGVKIDFKGYSILCPPFIKKKLSVIQTAKQIQPGNCWMMILNNNDDIVMWLYNGSNAMEQITFEQLFDDPKLIAEMSKPQ